jgi:hypothetical protein
VRLVRVRPGITEPVPVRRAAADPDPWHGLVTSLEKVCEIQAVDRGLREVMLGSGLGPQRQARIHQRIAPFLGRLVARAQEHGTLRSDVVGIDIPRIQLMVAAIIDNTGAPDLWRRYLRLLVDGLRAQPDTPALPPIPETGGSLIDAVSDAAVSGPGTLDGPAGPA